jgi:hypothetical protein
MSDAQMKHTTNNLFVTLAKSSGFNRLVSQMLVEIRESLGWSWGRSTHSQMLQGGYSYLSSFVGLFSQFPEEFVGLGADDASCKFSNGFRSDLRMFGHIDL